MAREFPFGNTYESRLILAIHKYQHQVHRGRYWPPLKWSLSLVGSVLNHLVIQGIFNCFIPKEVVMGRVAMPHPFGIVLTPRLRIGNGVKIFHQVTIGINELSDRLKADTVIGDNVFIGAGAKIIGNGLRIGDGAVIGANAVVLEDIPAGVTAVGVPARVIKERPAHAAAGGET